MQRLVTRSAGKDGAAWDAKSKASQCQEVPACAQQTQDKEIRQNKDRPAHRRALQRLVTRSAGKDGAAWDAKIKASQCKKVPACAQQAQNKEIRQKTDKTHQGIGELCSDWSREAPAKMVPRGTRKSKRANAKKYQHALNKLKIKK